jgi:hypothetical protein
MGPLQPPLLLPTGSPLLPLFHGVAPLSLLAALSTTPGAEDSLKADVLATDFMTNALDGEWPSAHPDKSRLYAGFVWKHFQRLHK